MRFGYLGLVLTCASDLALASVTIVKEEGVEIVKEWEKPAPNEIAVNQKLTQILMGAAAKRDAGQRLRRDAHPRSLGCIVAKFSINKDIDPEFRHGVFQPGKSYDALVRTSSGGLSPKPDGEADSRGFAMKLFNIPGKKVSPIEPNATTQDFLMLSYPIFPAVVPEEFMGFVRASLKFGSPAPFLFPELDPKKWRVRNAATTLGVNTRFKTETSLIQHRVYFSAMPFLLGEKPIKFGAISCDYPNDKMVRPENPGPDFLREQMRDHLAEKEACFDFVVQRYKPGYPIEDGMGWWPSGVGEDAEPTVFLKAGYPDLPVSPFIKIGRITIPKQKVNLDETAPENIYCDNLTMNPFHSIPEHRPLGAINRARGSIYDSTAEGRHKFNKSVVKEPSSLNEFLSLKKQGAKPL